MSRKTAAASFCFAKMALTASLALAVSSLVGCDLGRPISNQPRNPNLRPSDATSDNTASGNSSMNINVSRALRVGNELIPEAKALIASGNYDGAVKILDAASVLLTSAPGGKSAGDSPVQPVPVPDLSPVTAAPPQPLTPSETPSATAPDATSGLFPAADAGSGLEANPLDTPPPPSSTPRTESDARNLKEKTRHILEEKMGKLADLRFANASRLKIAGDIEFSKGNFDTAYGRYLQALELLSKL